MNYTGIENLSENEIYELYNDILEGENFISDGGGIVWYVECDNGIRGQSPAIWYCNYGVHCRDGRYQYNTYGNYGATTDVCGLGSFGRECANC